MRLKLGEILLRAEVIDEPQLLAALGEQKRWGHRLGVTLVKMGFLTEEDLVNGLANQLDLPIAHLDNKRILPEVLALVPEEMADTHMCLPLFLKREGTTETLYLGVDDPTNLQVLDDLSFSIGMRVQPVLVASSELCQGIDFFYRGCETPKPEPEPEPESEQTAKPLTLPAIEIDVEEKSDEEPARGRRRASGEVESVPGYDTKTRKMLRALAEMLVEQQVIEREAWMQRLLEVLDDEDS